MYMCVCVWRERERERENTRSTLLKLICIISSIYRQKIKCFEYFLPFYQATQNGRPKVVSWLDVYF